MTKEELFNKAQERFNSWGAEYDFIPGAKVSTFMLEGIDKFLETFKE